MERRIRDGVDAGEFERLPGAGQPLGGLDGDHDDDWWVKEKLRREGIDLLPPTLRIRKELEDARAAIARCDTESGVRAIVDDINQRIRDVNRRGAAGPPSTVMPLDVESVVERWRSGR